MYTGKFISLNALPMYLELYCLCLLYCVTPPPVSQTPISKIIVVLRESAFSPIYHELSRFFPIILGRGVFLDIHRYVPYGLRKTTMRYDLLRFCPDFVPKYPEFRSRVTTKQYDLDRLSRFLTTMDYDAQRFTATYADRSESTTSFKSFFSIMPLFRTLGIKNPRFNNKKISYHMDIRVTTCQQQQTTL